MSAKNNKSQADTLDINEVVKNNFELYFQEVEKVMPQYLQSITKLQQDFLVAWKKTVNSSIELQKEFTEKANIKTSITKEIAITIQKVAEEYIKSKNIQNETVLSSLEMTSNNLQNLDTNFESVSEFNKKFLEFWTNFYSNNK